MRVKLYKIFIFLLSVALAAAVFFNQEWVMKQYDKMCSMYNVYRGDKALSKLKVQKAIDFYNKALKLYPEHYSAWYNLGNIYVLYEDYYSAVDAYEQAIKYNPKMIIARMNYGIVSAERLGDFDGAIAQYNEIINTKRHLLSIPFVYSNKKSYKINKGLAYYNMGIAYRQKSLYLGDKWFMQREFLNKALESYKKAVKILKKDYDARYNLALTYHLLGDYNNAGLTYCKAIQLAPMNYEAHYNLAILLRHMKYYKESLEELKKATSLITNSDGSSNRQRYIFNVMNDVTRTILYNAENNLMVDKLDSDETASQIGVTYVHGKLVATDALDKAVLKNFRTCASRKIFLDED